MGRFQSISQFPTRGLATARFGQGARTGPVRLSTSIKDGTRSSISLHFTSSFQIPTYHLLAAQVIYGAPSFHTLTIREKNRGANAVMGVMH
jgi:hypothetical protein